MSRSTIAVAAGLAGLPGLSARHGAGHRYAVTGGALGRDGGRRPGRHQDRGQVPNGGCRPTVYRPTVHRTVNDRRRAFRCAFPCGADSWPITERTDPWAVVSAYHGAIESGNDEQAYALIGDGATTGQSYQQFADGFACSGEQAPTENWDSGDQVDFDLGGRRHLYRRHAVLHRHRHRAERRHRLAANVAQTG